MTALSTRWRWGQTCISLWWELSNWTPAQRSVNINTVSINNKLSVQSTQTQLILFIKRQCRFVLSSVSLYLDPGVNESLSFFLCWYMLPSGGVVFSRACPLPSAACSSSLSGRRLLTNHSPEGNVLRFQFLQLLVSVCVSLIKNTSLHFHSHLLFEKPTLKSSTCVLSVNVCETRAGFCWPWFCKHPKTCSHCLSSYTDV